MGTLSTGLKPGVNETTVEAKHQPGKLYAFVLVAVVAAMPLVAAGITLRRAASWPGLSSTPKPN